LPAGTAATPRPAGVATDARRRYLLGALRLAEVLALFGTGGVPAIPLKGPALAERLYPDPAARPFTDLDLLIRPRDLPRATEILRGAGYRHLEAGHSLAHELCFRHATTFARWGSVQGLPVDLHWSFVDAPGPWAAEEIDLDEIWGRALPGEWWGQPAWSLETEDLLIYLATHWAVHHACSGVVWSEDLALLLGGAGEPFDWEAVVERARRWRVRQALAVALDACEARFGPLVPPAPRAALGPTGFRGALARRLVRRGGVSLERLDYLLPLLLLDRRRDFLGALATGLVPPPAWVRSRYGKASTLGGYLAHYGRIARVSLRTALASRPGG
jgi:hypothetical protein